MPRGRTKREILMRVRVAGETHHREDPPGVRSGGSGEMYLAYLRDPDGNKLCALHRMPAA